MRLSDAWAGLQFIADSTFHKLSKWSKCATPLLYLESKFDENSRQTRVQRKPSSKGQTIILLDGWGLTSLQNKISAELRQLKKHCATRRKKLSKCFGLFTAGLLFDIKKFLHVKLLPTKKKKRKMHNLNMTRKYSCSKILPNTHLPPPPPLLNKIMVHPCM